MGANMQEDERVWAVQELLFNYVKHPSDVSYGPLAGHHGRDLRCGAITVEQS